jgi:hypothetical protein
MYSAYYQKIAALPLDASNERSNSNITAATDSSDNSINSIITEEETDCWSRFKAIVVECCPYIVGLLPNIISSIMYFPKCMIQVINFLGQFPDWLTINVLSILNSSNYWFDFIPESWSLLFSQIIVVQMIIAGCNMFKFAVLCLLHCIDKQDDNRRLIDYKIDRKQIEICVYGFIFYTFLFCLLVCSHMFVAVSLIKIFIGVLQFLGMFASTYYHCFLPYKKCALNANDTNNNLNYYKYRYYLSFAVLLCEGSLVLMLPVLALFLPVIASWCSMAILVASCILNVMYGLYEISSALLSFWQWLSLAENSTCKTTVVTLCSLAVISGVVKGILCLTAASFVAVPVSLILALTLLGALCLLECMTTKRATNDQTQDFSSSLNNDSLDPTVNSSSEYPLEKYSSHFDFSKVDDSSTTDNLLQPNQEDKGRSLCLLYSNLEGSNKNNQQRQQPDFVDDASQYTEKLLFIAKNLS